jgi:hypothetical protein
MKRSKLTSRRPGAPDWVRENEADSIAIGSCGSCVTVGVGADDNALVAHLDPEDARDMASTLLAIADETTGRRKN